MHKLSSLVGLVREEATRTHERTQQGRGAGEMQHVWQEAGMVFQERMVQIATACNTLVEVLQRRFLYGE